MPHSHLTYSFNGSPFNMRTLFVRLALPAFLMGLVFLLVLVMNVLLIKPIYKAKSGLLDVSEWHAQSNENIPLAGEWAIFWDEFIDTESLAQRLDGYGNFISLPGLWNGLPYAGSVLPAHGKASLGLRVKLASKGDYVLKIPALYSSYRLWVNGVLKVANPSLDDKFRQSNDVSKARLIRFNSQTEELTLLLHVANYRHRVGGVWESLRLSYAGDTAGSIGLEIKRDMALLAVLASVAMALLYLAWKRKRRAYVFLAVWAVLMALRAATIEERLLFVAFDIVNWELQQKLEYLFLYLNVPFFSLYLGYRFPRYFPAWLHLGMSALVAALVLLVLMSSAAVYSHTIIIFQLAVLVYGFAWLGGACSYVLEQGGEAWLLLFGSLILIAAAMNDIVLANILFADSLLNGINLTHYGALGFVFCVWLLYLKQPDFPSATDKTTASLPVLPSDSLQLAMQNYKQTSASLEKSKLCLEACKWVMYVWEHNGSSKLELAEQSGLWKVTNDEGTLKTRTLDKYLRGDTFPKRPRYRTVIKTLNFVAQQDSVMQEHVNLLVEASVLLSQ